MKEELRAWFPDFDDARWAQLEAWAALMREWNAKINLVSRKDIEHLEVNHLAPCLAVTRVLKLMHGARVLDVGTGGGLPGVVMAMCYPQAHFLCVDSVGKKVGVVEDLAKRLEIRNLEVRHCRAETLAREVDFVTGRAVTSLPVFVSWIHRIVRRGYKHSLENGVLYWHGGALEAGLEPTRLFEFPDLLPGADHLVGKRIVHLKRGVLPVVSRLASV